MATELDKAKSRLTHGRLVLEGQKAHAAQVPAKTYSPVRSRKLIKDMDQAIAGMEKHLSVFSKDHPH